MSCKNCLRIYGKTTVHKKDEVCPISCAGIVCIRCNMIGHFAYDCKEKWSHFTRPTTLEELIPYHLRLKYGIKTETLIEYKPREECMEMIDDINTINVKMNNKSIKTMLKYYGLSSSDDLDENIEKLSEYARERGYKILFMH
jgi:hypothetical protein